MNLKHLRSLYIYLPYILTDMKGPHINIVLAWWQTLQTSHPQVRKHCSHLLKLKRIKTNFLQEKNTAFILNGVSLQHILIASAGAFQVFINAWWALSKGSEPAQSCCLCPHMGYGHVARKHESNATTDIHDDEIKLPLNLCVHCCITLKLNLNDKLY